MFADVNTWLYVLTVAQDPLERKRVEKCGGVVAQYRSENGVAVGYACVWCWCVPWGRNVYGVVWCGMVWYGMVWHGMVW